MNPRLAGQLEYISRELFTRQRDKSLNELSQKQRYAAGRHIAAQFRHGMLWSNYGILWEIDHVVPRCLFSERDLLACFHFTNMRPRLCSVNRIEGRRSMRAFA